MPKTYTCPHCKSEKSSTHFSCAAGAKGGATTGPTKARTSEQARAAANARWAKAKGKK